MCMEELKQILSHSKRVKAIFEHGLCTPVSQYSALKYLHRCNHMEAIKCLCTGIKSPRMMPNATGQILHAIMSGHDTTGTRVSTCLARFSWQEGSEEKRGRSQQPQWELQSVNGQQSKPLNTAVRIALWYRYNIAYKSGWGYTVPTAENQHNQKGREKSNKKRNRTSVTNNGTIYN